MGSAISNRRSLFTAVSLRDACATMLLAGANRFGHVETVTNVSGFFDRLYHRSPVRPNMRYLPIRLEKRRSTAALQNVAALLRREFALASWSAAVFRRSWIVESLRRDINPTDPQATLEYWSV